MRAGFLARLPGASAVGRLTPFGKINLAVAGVVIAAGAGLIGNGLFIRAKAMLAQVLLDRAFDGSVATGEPVRPWSWASIRPMARLEFPRLGRAFVALDDSTGDALAFGPGHLPGTVRPGEPGLSVFAAHRDTHFRLLGKVRTGDVIRVRRIDGALFDYKVTRSRVVKSDEADFDLDSVKPVLALSTCWPLDSDSPGPFRYLVEAEMLPKVAKAQTPAEGPLISTALMQK